MATINDNTVDEYLSALAAKQSTPGGGAVAAVTGAQAAALMAMVCEFTAVEDTAQQLEVDAILKLSNATRAEFIALGDQDAIAFSEVMAAYRLPKKTETDKENRKQQIQSSLIQAATAPLNSLLLACKLSHSIAPLITYGNSNLITDTAIAAQLLAATIRAAELNILINLKSIKNQGFNKSSNSALKEGLEIAHQLNNTAQSITDNL